MIVSETTMLLIAMVGATYLALGITTTAYAFSADHSECSKEKIQKKRIGALFLLASGITATIIMFSAIVPEHMAISDMHNEAETETGVVEKIQYDERIGVILTVNGQELDLELDQNNQIGLYGDAFDPYAYVTPEIDATLEYTTVNYDGSDYVRISGYMSESKN